MSAHLDNRVFVLVIITHISLEGEIKKSDPKAVVFSSYELLCLYLMDSVQAHIHLYEERFAVPLMKYMRYKEFEKFIKLWKYAVQNNGSSTGFDAYWEEQPLAITIVNENSRKFRVRKNCEYSIDLWASSEDEAIQIAAETPIQNWDSQAWSFSDAEEISKEER